MYIPSPSLMPLVSIQNIDKFMSNIDGLQSISGGIAVYGSAAAYALVWELGSRKLKKPGPKTLWSTNRLGRRAILTRQAPFGYVGYVSDQFWPIIRTELAKVDFTGSSIRLAIEVAMDNASQKIARLVSDTAPVDSGDLRSQIQYVDSGDLGNSAAMVSAGTLIL